MDFRLALAPFQPHFAWAFFFLSFLMFISFWLCLCLFGFSFSRRNICKIHKATGQFSLFELRTSLAILPVYSPQSPWNPQSEHQANIFSLGQGKDDSFLGQFLFCFLFIFACRVSSILCFACFWRTHAGTQARIQRTQGHTDRKCDQRQSFYCFLLDKSNCLLNIQLIFKMFPHFINYFNKMIPDLWKNADLNN